MPKSAKQIKVIQHHNAPTIPSLYTRPYSSLLPILLITLLLNNLLLLLRRTARRPARCPTRRATDKIIARIAVCNALLVV